MAYVEDTIAAIATAAGPGAVAIIRMSGPSAFDLAKRLCTAPGGGSPDLSESHRARLGRVRDASGRVVDDVLLLPMRGPRSYTGEDVVEIQCHGGTLVPRLILGCLLGAGAREARPGEFTLRAFLNGRMDLCQAEAVADVVAASSEPALEIARGQLEGRLSRELGELRDVLLDARALVEAHLDFPEDDLPAEAAGEIAGAVEGAAARMRDLLGGFERARLARDGARVVLVGKPNVGKSSLLNSLLGRDRALVSAEPGTTRDYLEEPMALGARGLRVLLVDTAGLREGSGAIERAGIERTLELAASGDVVVAVLDSSGPLGVEDVAALDTMRGAARAGTPCIVAMNKADLSAQPGSAGGFERALDGVLPPGGEVPRVPVSARTGLGVPELCSAIEGALAALDGRESIESRPLASRERHRAALRRALEALSGSSPDDDLEIVAQSLQGCVFELEGLLGEATSEEILDRVFEKFCIGK